MFRVCGSSLQELLCHRITTGRGLFNCSLQGGALALAMTSLQPAARPGSGALRGIKATGTSCRLVCVDAEVMDTGTRWGAAFRQPTRSLHKH